MYQNRSSLCQIIAEVLQTHILGFEEVMSSIGGEPMKFSLRGLRGIASCAGVSLRTAARDNAPVDRRWPSYEDGRLQVLSPQLSQGSRRKCMHICMYVIYYGVICLWPSFDCPSLCRPCCRHGAPALTR